MRGAVRNRQSPEPDSTESGRRNLQPQAEWRWTGSQGSRATTPLDRAVAADLQLIPVNSLLTYLEFTNVGFAARTSWAETNFVTEDTWKMAGSSEQQELQSLRERVARLEAQQAQTEALYKDAPVGLCYVDSDLRYIQINKCLAAINGQSVKQHLGRTIGEILPEIAPEVEPQLRHVLDTGEPLVKYTGRVQTPGHVGIESIYEYSYFPVRSGDGTIVGVSCVVEDVTERKQTEKALATSEALYRTLLETAPQIIWQGQPDGSVGYLNKAWEDMTGMPLTDALGWGWTDALHPDDAPALLEKGKQAFEQGTPYSAECRFRAKDGSYRTTDNVGVPVHDASGRIIRWVGIATDITERKRAEGALRESEALFRQIAENVREVFFVVDHKDNGILYVNPAYEKIWGRTCESLYQEPSSWSDAVFSEDRERVNRALGEQQRAGFNEEFRIARPDGSIRWMHDRVFPIRDQKGEIYRLVGIGENITERKQTEQELVRLERLSALGEMAQGIAHNFNNLLVGVLGYAQLIQMRASDPEIVEDATQLIESAIRAKDLVRRTGPCEAESRR